jgi:hypothetical protein
LCYPRFHHHILQCTPLEPILNHLNPFYVFRHFHEVHSNVILLFILIYHLVCALEFSHRQLYADTPQPTQ